jgi:hypothetical protein
LSHFFISNETIALIPHFSLFTFHLTNWYCKHNRRSFARLAFRRNRAAVGFDDSFAYLQPDTGASRAGYPPLKNTGQQIRRYTAA